MGCCGLRRRPGSVLVRPRWLRLRLGHLRSHGVWRSARGSRYADQPNLPGQEQQVSGRRPTAQIDGVVVRLSKAASRCRLTRQTRRWLNIQSLGLNIYACRSRARRPASAAMSAVMSKFVQRRPSGGGPWRARVSPRRRVSGSAGGRPCHVPDEASGVSAGHPGGGDVQRPGGGAVQHRDGVGGGAEGGLRGADHRAPNSLRARAPRPGRPYGSRSA